MQKAIQEKINLLRLSTLQKKQRQAKIKALASNAKKYEQPFQICLANTNML
jgi:hypothetical protein